MLDSWAEMRGSPGVCTGGGGRWGSGEGGGSSGEPKGEAGTLSGCRFTEGSRGGVRGPFTPASVETCVPAAPGQRLSMAHAGASGGMLPM